jgi:hypothetical protein
MPAGLTPLDDASNTSPALGHSGSSGLSTSGSLATPSNPGFPNGLATSNIADHNPSANVASNASPAMGHSGNSSATATYGSMPSATTNTPASSGLSASKWSGSDLSASGVGSSFAAAASALAAGEASSTPTQRVGPSFDGTNAKDSAAPAPGTPYSSMFFKDADTSSASASASSKGEAIVKHASAGDAILNILLQQGHVPIKMGVKN